MKLFSYIVKNDTGFAPNPFFGYCTLACCKPVIRRTADAGDWVVGLTPKRHGHKIVYAMQVREKLTFPQYWLDSRFHNKRPDYQKDGVVFKSGDNIYKPLKNGGYRQLCSMHSKGDHEDPDKKKHDLSGTFVLVSKRFVYFGTDAIDLPSGFDCLIVARGHKCHFPDGIIRTLESFVSGFDPGVHAPPRKWPSDDSSWQQ